MLLSEGLWRERWGGRDALGQTIMLEAEPHTVVGVMPAVVPLPGRRAAVDGAPGRRRGTSSAACTRIACWRACARARPSARRVAELAQVAAALAAAYPRRQHGAAPRWWSRCSGRWWATPGPRS